MFRIFFFDEMSIRELTVCEASSHVAIARASNGSAIERPSSVVDSERKLPSVCAFNQNRGPRDGLKATKWRKMA